MRGLASHMWARGGKGPGVRSPGPLPCQEVETRLSGFQAWNDDLALCATHQSRPSQGKGNNPHDAHDGEHRDRGLRRTAWQYELEERHWIAPLRLHRPDGAISVANDERRSLDRQEGDTRPQAPTPSSRQHGHPDIAEAPELCHGPGRMHDAPCPSSTAECRPAHRMRCGRSADLAHGAAPADTGGIGRLASARAFMPSSIPLSM
jgi:hypothetical protein